MGCRLGRTRKMANIKLNIGDPKSKKTFQLELDEQGTAKLHGKKLGETFKGELIDRPGYEFNITGGSDAAGFPMRNDIDGTARRKILITNGTGNRATRKGMRLRRTVAGNTISATTVQVNAKITKHGTKPLKDETEKKKRKKSKNKNHFFNLISLSPRRRLACARRNAPATTRNQAENRSDRDRTLAGNDPETSL